MPAFRRIWEGNVFTGVCLSPGEGGIPTSGPRSFLRGYPSVWFQVLSEGYSLILSLVLSQVLLRGVNSQPVWGYSPGQDRFIPPPPLARIGEAASRIGATPPLHRLPCGWFAPCGFPQEDFLVWFLIWKFEKCWNNIKGKKDNKENVGNGKLSSENPLKEDTSLLLLWFCKNPLGDLTKMNYA